MAWPNLKIIDVRGNNEIVCDVVYLLENYVDTVLSDCSPKSDVLSKSDYLEASHTSSEANLINVLQYKSRNCGHESVFAIDLPLVLVIVVLTVILVSK